MSHAIKMSYKVDGDDFTAAGAASSEVKRMLKQLGMPPDLTKRVAICMYEGEINMVIHANGGQALASIYPDKVEIVLQDTGPGIADVAQAMQEGFTTAGEDARNLGFGAGMGLPNMKKYSDQMEIESTIGVGTTVRMTVQAPKQGG